MRIAILAWAVLAAAAPAWTQAPEDATVRIGVFMQQPDGTLGGFAGYGSSGDGLSFSTLVWFANGRCSFGAADLDESPPVPPESATDAWAIRGQVTNLAAGQASVQLEWRRLRTAGTPVDGAWASRPLTLPLNQLVPIESLAQNSDDRCPASVTFGARFAPRFDPSWSFGQGTAATGAGGGRGSGSGTGTGTGSGGAARIAATATVPPYTAELWLVHSVPGKPDTVLPAKIPVIGGSAAFSFPPVRFVATGGAFAVTVSGRLRVLQTNDPQARMYTLAADRTASFTPSSRPSRDPVEPGLEGRASTSGVLPGPDDVVAFEMPPLKVIGAPSVPDRFSIRLRLRPVGAGN
jgi:hypothetical protein